MLKLQDKWVWDFWFAQDGADTHIFYLQADKSLQREAFRHWNVSVGHAVSQDLRQWEILPDAIHPSAPGAWDDFTTWTGSVIQHAGVWYMFYTGSTRRERGYVQRVGYATSLDLIHWEKASNSPVMEADPRWYEKLSLDLWHDEAWRDPYVFQHPETGMFHAYITGRVNAGDSSERGVVAHGISRDLHTWEVLPPVTEPGNHGQLEVPQLVEIEGRYYLLYSTNNNDHSTKRLARPGASPVTGTHYMVGDSPTGPFRYITDEFLVGDAHGSLYSGKLVQGADEQWYYMAFHNFAPDGSFIGEISDPYPVTIAEDGHLLVKPVPVQS